MPFPQGGYELYKLERDVAFKTFCDVHELKANDHVYIELNTQPGQVIDCGNIVESVLVDKVSAPS